MAQRKVDGPENVTELRKKPLNISQTTVAAHKGKRYLNTRVIASPTEISPAKPNKNTAAVAFSGLKPSASKCRGVEVDAEMMPNPRKNKLTAKRNK